MPVPSAFFPQQSTTSSAQDTACLSTLNLSQHHASSPETRNGLAHSRSQQQVRGLRFPSSRRFLWDRTPAGPQVLIDTEDHLPRVQIAASVFSAIARAAEQQKPHVILQLSISVTPTNQVAALVQELDPLGAQLPTECLRLACPLSSDADEAFDSGRLQGAFAAQLDQRQTATVQQLYAFSAAAAAGAIPVDQCALQLQLLMPVCSLLATPLYTKRLCNVPLAEALLKPGKFQTPQTGYLSMDQARSLLPLEATDVNVYSIPLVGVWVKGPNSVLHPLVAAACLCFTYSSLLADRAVNPENGAFLLLLCPEGDPVSKCFEVCPTDPQQLQLSMYQLDASMSRSAGPAQYGDGGLLRADWNISSQQPQPLPGHLKTQHTRPAIAAIPQSVVRRAAAGQAVLSSTLALPGPGSVAPTDSPIVLGRAGLNGKAGPASLARNSAPMIGSGGSNHHHQQCAAVAARRSLPLPGTGVVAAAAETRCSAAAAAIDAATGGAAIGRKDLGYGVYNRKGSSSAEPEPCASFHAHPYGSPPSKQWPAASQPSTMAAQQQAQQQTEGQEEQQQWVQLGEQLLTAPTANAARQQLRVPDAIQQVAAVSSGNSRSMSAQQPQAPHGSIEASAVSPAATGSAAATAVYEAASGNNPDSNSAAAAAASPQLRIKTGQYAAASPVRQQQHDELTSYRPAGASVSDGSAHQEARPVHFQVHSTNPVSPSVQAGVALSNLALLQHLSTGQLEQAIEKAASPSKSRTSSPAKTAAAARRSSGGTAAAECGTGTWGSVGHMVSSSQRADTAPSLGPGTDATTWSRLKPQTPDADRASLVGSSVLMGSPSFGPSVHFVPPSTSVDSCREVTASFHHSHPLEHQTHAAAGATATAALRAATAAVHRLSPGPYSRGLGVQRYAADAAVMSSQDHGQGEWSGQTASAGERASFAVVDAAGGTDQLEDALYQSLTAAVSSAAALEAAGNLMHPYHAPGAGMSYQQVALQQQQQPQQQLFSNVWSDPVAHALQGEVQRLREEVRSTQAELLQLRHQLMAAAMPRPEALDLPPLHEPAPPAALPAPAAQPEPGKQQAGQHLQLPGVQQQQQQGPAAAGCSAVHDTVHNKAASEAPEEAGPAESAPQPSAKEGQNSSISAVVEGAATVAGDAATQTLQLTLLPDDAASHNHKAKAASCGPSTLESCGDMGAISRSSAETASGRQQQEPGLGYGAAKLIAVIAADGNQQELRQHTHQQQQQDVADGPEQLLVSAAARSPNQAATAAATAAGSWDSGADNSSGTSAVAAAGSCSGGVQTATIASSSAPGVSNITNDSSLPSSPAASVSPAKPAGATPAPAMGDMATPLSAATTNKSVKFPTGSASSSVGGSQAFGGVRTSLEVPPLVEVVRTKYCALDDDSDDSDREFEERLMLKYGMKH